MSPLEIVQIIRDGGSFAALVLCLVLAAWKAWPLWVESVATTKANGTALKELLSSEAIHRAHNHEEAGDQLRRIESKIDTLLKHNKPARSRVKKS